MKTLREEFEELPDIKRKMAMLIKYDADSEMYKYMGVSIDEFYAAKLNFINGAWWAYQEQHKKILVYQKMIEVESCLNKKNILSSGAFHHGENVIHVGTIDNPNQTLTINVDENGNIETSNHNGDDK